MAGRKQTTTHIYIYTLNDSFLDVYGICFFSIGPMSDVSCFWQLSSPLKPLLLLTCSEPKWAAWSAPISQGMAMANLSSTEQHSLWKIVGMHKCACAHVYIQETEIFDFGFCFCGGGGGSTSGSASGSTSGSEVRLRVRVLLWLTKHCLRICWFCIFFVGGRGGGGSTSGSTGARYDMDAPFPYLQENDQTLRSPKPYFLIHSP